RRIGHEHHVGAPAAVAPVGAAAGHMGLAAKGHHPVAARAALHEDPGPVGEHAYASGAATAPGRADRDAPAQAPATRPIATTSRRARSWPSTMNPTRAATAGSMLMRIPNTCDGSRRSASSSSVYGIADDS